MPYPLTPRAALAVVGALALGALAAGCDRDALYSDNTFSDNVYKAYAECSEAEIRFLAGKHNIQTAFDNCGSNNFVTFAWAPDGIQLYFQLPFSAHIMNAEDKSIGTMPTEVPVANVAWLDRDLVVVPLDPAEGSEKFRLVLFNRIQASMQTLEVAPTAISDLQPSGARDKVYFTGVSGGERHIYVADFTHSTVEPAFPFITGAVTSFTYTPAADAVAWGSGGDNVTISRGSDGTELFKFTDASRAVVHPEGRYIALESLGEPISPFDQRTWDELSPEAREREMRRSKAWLERQPEWVVKEVNPPTIDIYDAEVNKRFRFTSFYGDRFQWYPTNYFASFVLWGLEGKEVNKNVALTDLHERLRMSAKGDSTLGVQEWTGPARRVPTAAEVQARPGN